jgi:hypothetical protein
MKSQLLVLTVLVSAIRACESAPVRALLAAHSKRKSAAPAIAAK